MRLNIRITAISSLEKHLSVKTCCTSNEPSVKSGLLCWVSVAGRKIKGIITSVTEKNKKLAIQLRTDRHIDTLAVLFPYQYQEKDLPLLIEEKVEIKLYKEAETLLHALSLKTGKPIEELLLELTAYKPGVEGRDDLRFVSEKQMGVIIDKIKTLLEETEQVS